MGTQAAKIGCLTHCALRLCDECYRALKEISMNNDEAALDMGPIGREIWEDEIEKREKQRIVLPDSLTDGSTCLTRAQALVDGPRQAAYGPPSENHGCTVALWNAYLRRRGVLNEDLTTRDVCWLMVLMKVSRDAHTPKQDNLDDVCGWARNAEIVTKEAA